MDALRAKINEEEDGVSDIEDKIMERKEDKEKREKQLMDLEGKFQEISDTIKWNNIRIIGVPEEEEREGQKVYLSKS